MSMATIRAQLEEVARGFEPAAHAPDDCVRVVDDAIAIEHLVGAIKALAAARVAETDLWRRGGDQSPAHDLARRSGASVRDAKEAIAVGKRLAQVPALDEATRRGELSTAQAAAIAGATGERPEAAARLVGAAKRLPLAGLRDECLRTKAAGRSGDENHRKVKAGRRLREWVDGEGGWNLAMRDTLEVGAEIMAVIRKLRDRRFRQAARDGETEPTEAYAADAMLDMARRAAAGATGDPTSDDAAQPLRDLKVIVRIDWDALVRGWPVDGEVCEIAGLGPVPVSVVQSMIASGDAFLAALATKGHDVHAVAHLGRHANAFQATGLDWLQPTCTVETCPNTALLQVDHRHDWADTKVTLLRWLDRLCKHHHDLKTRANWMLVEGHGKRPMVAPDDPRHPGRAGPVAA